MSGALNQPYELTELVSLSGPVSARLSLDDVPRFVEALRIDQQSDTVIDCYLETLTGDSRQVNVSGYLRGEVLLECQRCLGVMQWPMDINFAWKISGESAIHLMTWVEDELILSLPAFAKHERGKCDDRLVKKYVVADSDSAPDTKQAFAGLKDLLSGK